MNRLAFFALGLSALLVGGCAAPPRAYHSRMAPTGIEVGDAIAVELRSLVRPGRSQAFTEADQESITRCIERAMRESNPRLFMAKAGAAQVRYLVRIEILTVHSQTQMEVAGGGAVGLWALGGKWKETSYFQAEVFDVKNDRLAGKLGSSAVGDEGRGAVVFLVIPVFPIVYWSNTEERACQALGKELAGFVAEGPVTVQSEHDRAAPAQIVSGADHAALDGEKPILRVRPSSNGRFPSGQLYVVDRKKVTEAETTATVLVVFDKASAAGDRSSRNEVTADCSVRRLAVGPMETFPTPDGGGPPTRAATTRETRIPDHRWYWVQSVLRAICDT